MITTGKYVIQGKASEVLVWNSAVELFREKVLAEAALICEINTDEAAKRCKSDSKASDDDESDATAEIISRRKSSSVASCAQPKLRYRSFLEFGSRFSWHHESKSESEVDVYLLLSVDWKSVSKKQRFCTTFWWFR